MSLLSIDFKILKALANCIQYIKRIMHHNEVGFIPRLQGWFNTWKWITMLIIQHINKLKKKSTWIHKSTQKKTFDKIRHPFMNNTFRKIERKGNFLSLIKGIVVGWQLTLRWLPMIVISYISPSPECGPDPGVIHFL